MDKDVVVGRYVWAFALTYLGLMLLNAVLLLGFELDLGSAFGLVVVLASGIVAGGRFADDHRRAPTRSEKSRLVWRSFLITLVFGTLPGALLLPQMLPDAGAPLLFGALLFGCLLQFACVSYGYGRFAERRAARL